MLYTVMFPNLTTLSVHCKAATGKRLLLRLLRAFHRSTAKILQEVYYSLPRILNEFFRGCQHISWENTGSTNIIFNHRRPTTKQQKLFSYLTTRKIKMIQNKQ